MPRGSSKSIFSSKSSVSKPVTTPSYTQQHNVKVEQPGFFSNVMQGFGLGAGQSLAFNMFRSSPIVQQPTNKTETQDIPFPKEYIQCMKEYNNNSDACKQYLENNN